MATIGFIGLGNMGAPMAANLVKAGHDVTGFDLSEAAIEEGRQAGCEIAASAIAAAAGKDVVITMLPAGKHVISVYEEIKGDLKSGASYAWVAMVATRCVGVVAGPSASDVT